MARNRRDTDPSKTDRSDLTGVALKETKASRRDSGAQSIRRDSQWLRLVSEVSALEQGQSPSNVFGASATSGAVYRWGVASAQGAACDDSWQSLSRWAAGAKSSKKWLKTFDWKTAIDRFHEAQVTDLDDPLTATQGVIWASTLPGLLERIDEPVWWDLLAALQEYRDRVNRSDVSRSVLLIGMVEMGLTLSWRLSALPSCLRMESKSLEALSALCKHGEETISDALARPDTLRLVLASLTRSRMIALRKPTGGRKSSEKRKLWQQTFDDLLIELSTWVAALTRRDGSPVFSELASKEVRDDLGENGLLLTSASVDPDAVRPAMLAALGKTKSGGRLAWQIGLPEAMLSDEDAKVACLLPEWDVRRGRLSVDYSREKTRIEWLAGKLPVLCGEIETQITLDGQELQPIDGWVATCEYSDDDVHYMEIEQPWSQGYVLQRQWMVVREDRCGMICDSVVHGTFAEKGDGQSVPGEISYQARMPIAQVMHGEPESDTSEMYLCKDQPLAMVLPLAADEWRNNSNGFSIRETSDQHLLSTARGRGQLCVPLWIDFSRNRFRKPRTWRQLTVVHDLNLVADLEAVAYRIQVGKEQWVLYRSMTEPTQRTFFSKQMIVDFYCARFDAEQEEFEDLISVDDDPGFGQTMSDN